jgi:radical SAM superfamily enzyme YgiQ (UPF0313 family)
VKIVLVNCRTGIYPPLGLCYLSAHVKKNLTNVNIRLVELPLGTKSESAVEKIAALKPDIVGITTYTVGYHEVLEICSKLRKAQAEVVICLGGPHITSLPGSLPESANVGVVGEGEETFLELCQCLQAEGDLSPTACSSIEGICYRHDADIIITGPRRRIASLDDIPPPDLSILNMNWYTAYRTYFSMKGNFRGFVLLTSRGCPFSCRFCQASAQWGRCRYHSPLRVIDELARIRLDYPRVNAINIIDDLFIGDRQRLREIIRLIRERNLHDGIVFNVNGHVNLVDAEIIDLLKSINVMQIAYGFESGSERVLQFLKKNSTTVERNRLVADLTNAVGIGVGGQFMIGSPGETENELRETIDFIKMTPMSHVHISTTTPMPGTELWEICKSSGLVSDDMDWRKLDFGNPDNPDLIYCNEEALPRNSFEQLRSEVKRAADRWNPVPSIIANLSYWQLYESGEFVRRGFQGVDRLIRVCANKIADLFRNGVNR